MFIDSHAHLEMPQFEDDLSDVLQRAKDSRVEIVVTVGTNLRSSERALEIARCHPQVFVTVGIHPHEARECSRQAINKLREMATRPKVVAIGEMGLDFYRNLSPPEKQVQAFREQIRLAREIGKPIVVHARDAHSLILKILKEEQAQEVGGVIHCFSGDLPTAKASVALGFSISVPGSITFKNASRLRNVIQNLPSDRLLLETDSPFLAPVPFRGRRNEPCHIRYTAERVAGILKLPIETLAERVSANTRALFSLPPPR